MNSHLLLLLLYYLNLTPFFVLPRLLLCTTLTGEWNIIRDKIIICLRKSEVSVERISVCNVIENSMKHGILLYQ